MTPRAFSTHTSTFRYSFLAQCMTSYCHSMCVSRVSGGLECLLLTCSTLFCAALLLEELYTNTIMSSWVSPSMARFGHSSPPKQPESSSTETRVGPEFEPVSLGSSSVLKPLTPPNVLNLTPNTCLAASEFRVLLRQYRALDDGITTRLNRSFARSRDLGQSPSPSLLSGGGKVTSSSSTDLGTSTYANAAPGACATFWRELVDVWIGREEVVKFCIRVVDDKTASLPSPQPPKSPAVQQPKTGKRSTADDKLLDADYYNQVRVNASLSSRDNATSQDLVDDVGRSGSRSENTAQVLRRQLHNELAVESIIRARSLDGKSSISFSLKIHF